MTLFIILALAVWRLTSLLCYEDGPYDIFLKLRTRFADKRWIKLNCFLCISVWVSFIFSFILPFNFIIGTLALSTAVIIIDRILVD